MYAHLHTKGLRRIALLFMTFLDICCNWLELPCDSKAYHLPVIVICAFEVDCIYNNI